MTAIQAIQIWSVVSGSIRLSFKFQDKRCMSQENIVAAS